MITWYNDENLKIEFDIEPDVRIRYTTPFSTDIEIASIKKFPFRNKKPLEVRIEDKIKGRLYGFTIPAYNFDGLTIPRFAFSLIGVAKQDNRGLIAACLHDWLCLHKNLIWYDRALSTNVFNALLKVGGMDKLRRFIMKNSVAFFQTFFADWGLQWTTN